MISDNMVKMMILQFKQLMLVPKGPTFSKWKKGQFSKIDCFVHLKKVGMIITDSYKGGVHLGEIDFIDHLSKMDFTVETYTIFVT